MTKEVNLVLAGGGVKGIAVVGALKALEEEGYTFARIAGTSAGAVVGGLLAAGYGIDELEAEMHQVPYRKFRDEGLIDKFGIPGKALSLILEKGIYEGEFFCRWYEELLSRKNVRNFCDIKLDGAYPQYCGYKFVAIAANVTNGKLLRLPWDLPNYGLNPDDPLVSLAVRASISIPFYYEPVRLNGDYVVDGGVLSSYPIDTFKDDDIPTLGIKLSAKPGAIDRPHNITGPVSYAGAVLSSMTSVQDQVHLDEPDVIARTIFVDTGDIMSTHFDITKEQQGWLFNSGYKAAKKYLDTAK